MYICCPTRRQQWVEISDRADLIVAVVSDFDLVEAIPCEDAFPLLAGDEGRSIHGPTVANDQAVSVGVLGQVEEGVLNLKHRFEKVLLFKNRSLTT